MGGVVWARFGGGAASARELHLPWASHAASAPRHGPVAAVVAFSASTEYAKYEHKNNDTPIRHSILWTRRPPGRIHSEMAGQGRRGRPNRTTIWPDAG